MNRAIPALLLAALAACSPTIGGTPKDSGDTGTTGGDDGGGSGTGGDDTGEVGPCGEVGICALDISEAVGECGDGDPDRPRASADAASDGTITATLEGAEWGCCPTVTADGSASMRSGRIDLNAVTTGDDCDCICALDLKVTFTGVPSGEWALFFNGYETSVRVR
jgi:hypothetical protein